MVGDSTGIQQSWNQVSMTEAFSIIIYSSRCLLQIPRERNGETDSQKLPQHFTAAGLVLSRVILIVGFGQVICASFSDSP